MSMAEVLRPAETVQFSDGGTEYYRAPFYDSFVQRRHENGLLNGAFLDGHARAITDTEWNGIGRDERGYYYWMAAADR
jgi:prepilin-type processing-associated H-X9-DG protein